MPSRASDAAAQSTSTGNSAYVIVRPVPGSINAGRAPLAAAPAKTNSASGVAGISTGACGERYIAAGLARLLRRTPEQSAVDGFAEHVALHGGKDLRARLERIGGRRHVELRVERVELEHVVVARTGRRSAGPTIDLARRADLVAAI